MSKDRWRPNFVLVAMLTPAVSTRALSASKGASSRATPAQSVRGSEEVLGRAGTITVLRIDPDDDGAGHAGYPKCLVGRGAQGQTVWQFPRRLLFPGTGENTEAEIRAHFETIDAACLVPERATVVAIGRRQYGLRARDGFVLWRKARPNVPVVSLQPYRGGCFALVIPTGQPGIHQQPTPEHHSSLAYIDAQSGQWRWLRRVKVADRLVMENRLLRLYAGRRLVEQIEAASLFGDAR